MLKLAYLASPYSHIHENIREQRYDLVCEAVKVLAERGEYAIYSPIVHWHPIVSMYGMPTDAKFWQAQNEGVINAADVLLVLTLRGWIASKGVSMEIFFANEIKKRVIYIAPEDLGIEEDVDAK